MQEYAKLVITNEQLMDMMRSLVKLPDNAMCKYDVSIHAFIVEWPVREYNFVDDPNKGIAFVSSDDEQASGNASLFGADPHVPLDGTVSAIDARAADLVDGMSEDAVRFRRNVLWEWKTTVKNKPYGDPNWKERDAFLRRRAKEHAREEFRFAQDSSDC